MKNILASPGELYRVQETFNPLCWMNREMIWAVTKNQFQIRPGQLCFVVCRCKSVVANYHDASDTLLMLGDGRLGWCRLDDRWERVG